MKVEEYGSLSDANQAHEVDGTFYDENFQPSDAEIESLIAGVDRLERRLSHVVGREVSQGLWFGDKYIFYGTDSPENGSYFGVRKSTASRSPWAVLSHSDRGGEAKRRIARTVLRMRGKRRWPR